MKPTRRRPLVPLSVLCTQAALATLGATSARAAFPDIVIFQPAEMAPGGARAVADLARDLARLTGRHPAAAALPAPACRPGQVQLLVLGHEHDEQGVRRTSTLARQEFEVADQPCGPGRRIVMRGGSLLAGQWAVYALLEQVGVRYFHPEQTFYPAGITWPPAPLALRQKPSFQRRTMHVHRTHPVELAPPLRGKGPDVTAYQRRWIDWNVKLRQTSTDGWDADLVGAYAFERGFPRVAGLNLADTQQGGRPVLDPDSKVPEAQQIADALDRAIAPTADAPAASILSVQFSPSEFSITDPALTVKRLKTVAEHMARHHPTVELYAINHGTAQKPLPPYNLRFFDLPKLAPDNLGVKVHPLMLYDLERPAAGVYGNDSFAPLLRFVREEHGRRRIVHYPEASWWLTFDLPVPLALAPATLEARTHDIELLTPLLSRAESDTHGVYGHNLFTSGQEWGYWLVDYCTAKMVWDVRFDHRACLADVLGHFAHADVIGDALFAAEQRQIRDLRDPAVLRLLVGSDADTEAAEMAGITLHPLPPDPAEIVGWSKEQAAPFRRAGLIPLGLMAYDYHRWADAIERTLPDQNPTQAPWVRELRDGLRIMGLRAEHSMAIYGSALAYRDDLLRQDPEARARLARGLAEARSITARAQKVIRAREREYRYPPALTIEGGERGTAQARPNHTVYPYRYLSRTHRLFYWTRPNEQLAAVLKNPRPACPLFASLARGLAPAVDGARAVRELLFPRGSFTVEAPASASMVARLIPGLVVRPGAGTDDNVMVGIVEGNAAPTGAMAPWPRKGRHCGPRELSLPLQKVGALVLRDATLELDDEAGRAEQTVRIRGDVLTADIVTLLVGTGAFDVPGARRLVAPMLGATPDTLPKRVPFAITASGRERIF